jgi:soluble lytic murein transglycosylase-like protein
MKRHLLTLVICATAMVSGYTAHGQGVAPTRDAYGHLVWSDSEESRPPAKPAASTTTASSAPAPGTSSRFSGLVYWSNKEHRWKPVPASNSSTMKAARQAADEVNLVVGSRVDLGRGASRATIGTQPVVPGVKAPETVAPEAVDKAIDAAAHRHGVDPNLVRAVVKVESNFNPRAVSRKGAMGLMQLMPYTAKSLNVGNAFDPNQNVDAGVRHLKSLLENYNGNVELSLAAYNAGSGAVSRSRGIPPYRETRDYVKKITDIYWGSGFKPRVVESRDAEGHRYFSNND